jgi:hypothetical protein
MWLFIVSHGNLLLRSVKTADSLTRIDVLFQSVQAIQLPSKLDSVAIEMLPRSAIEQLKPEIGSYISSGSKVFAIRGLDYSGYIIASSVAWHEDTGEYNDPSYFQGEFPPYQ